MIFLGKFSLYYFWFKVRMCLCKTDHFYICSWSYCEQFIIISKGKKVFKLNVNQMYKLAPFTKTDHKGYRIQSQVLEVKIPFNFSIRELIFNDKL